MNSDLITSDSFLDKLDTRISWAFQKLKEIQDEIAIAETGTLILKLRLINATIDCFSDMLEVYNSRNWTNYKIVNGHVI